MTDDRYAPRQGPREGEEGLAAPPRDPGPPVRRSNGVAIAALVCGIVALALSLIPLINLLSLLLGLVALVCGFIGLGAGRDPAVGGRGLAIGGIVTGLLAMIVAVLVYVALVPWFRSNPALQQQLQDPVIEFEPTTEEATTTP